MSKSLEGQIPQIVNSNYLCMVICCVGQGYIARSVEGQSWLKEISKRCLCVISARTVLNGSVNLSV